MNPVGILFIVMLSAIAVLGFIGGLIMFLAPLLDQLHEQQRRGSE